MECSSQLFGAYLKCPTKCWLWSRGETGEGNAYAEWVKGQNESYRAGGVRRLQDTVPEGELAVAPATENLKAGKWRLAVGVPAKVKNLESWLHAVEQMPTAGTRAHFVPIRFAITNKPTRVDKLMLTFDAQILAQTLGCEVEVGRIIYGKDCSSQRVKTASLAGEVQELIEKIDKLVSKESLPELVLNRHCAECEFQARCRQKAIETDDLSLFSGMKPEERDRHRRKGIFTVNQLSYTFRPRRRPKKSKPAAQPHYFALQALAIRENTVYVNGSPQLPHADASVFLDIEGLSSSGPYYLLGALILRNG